MLAGAADIPGRCSACPRKYNYVPPSGPPDSPWLFIGEGPGKEENDKKIVFVGKTGREVNEHYLPLAGLRREKVRIINAIACLPDRPKGRVDLGREQDRELLSSCAGLHLREELQRCVGRRLLIPMGVLANYAIDPTINLELQHGIPIQTPHGLAFPMYHPAGGLHEPKKMLMIRNDWVRLGKYLKGKLKLPVDRYPNPDYGVADADEMESWYLECNDYTSPLALDTESSPGGKPYMLSFSACPGTGRVLLANDRDSLEILQCLLDAWKGPILFHNWLYDQPVTLRLGLHIRLDRVVDTMVCAYHLGNLPQGLKALAYRYLGMTMQDFDDLVTPYSTPIALSYLRNAALEDWPKPEEQLRRGDDGKLKLYSPQSMKTKLKRFLTDYGKNPDMDVFERWGKWEDSWPEIEAKMGPWPGKDIAHVPLDKAVYYSCRDADATLRLYPVLQRMRRNIRRRLPEHWEDAA